MAWTINYSDVAIKSLAKIDSQNRKRIVTFLENRIANLDNPKELGKPLKGKLGEFWRYRVGDYRVLCAFENDELVIIATLIGHRKNVYEV